MYLMCLDFRKAKSASVFGFDPLYTPESNSAKRTMDVPGAGCSRIVPANEGVLNAKIGSHEAMSAFSALKSKPFWNEDAVLGNSDVVSPE